MSEMWTNYIWPVIIIAAQSVLLLVLLLIVTAYVLYACLLYTSPSPRDRQKSRMPSSA